MSKASEKGIFLAFANALAFLFILSILVLSDFESKVAANFLLLKSFLVCAAIALFNGSLVAPTIYCNLVPPAAVPPIRF